MIREYKPADKKQCLEIFKSNCPKFFDQGELPLFINWLDHQYSEQPIYKSPVYSNSEKDAYYVIEIPGTGVIGCGGFYILKEQNEARLAWGMVHVDFHNKGHGTAIYKHRHEILKKDWPNHLITLGTSQHTFQFYEKMGMKVTAMLTNGYGTDLHRYDMILQ